MKETAYPLEFDLDRQKALRIRWSDGWEQQLPLPLLRKHCPCATCRDQREKQAKNPLHVMAAGPASIQDAATVETAELVGNYALRFQWKDGHNTGIYDFRLLRALGAGENGPQ